MLVYAKRGKTTRVHSTQYTVLLKISFANKYEPLSPFEKLKLLDLNYGFNWVKLRKIGSSKSKENIGTDMTHQE